MEFVYVLKNESFPNLLKIGKTTRSIEKRMSELNSTGVPTPFKIVKVYATKNCHALEKRIHCILDQYRLSKKKEFFKLNLSIIEKAIAEKSLDRFIISPEESLRIEAEKARIRKEAERQERLRQDAKRSEWLRLQKEASDKLLREEEKAKAKQLKEKQAYEAKQEQRKKELAAMFGQCIQKSILFKLYICVAGCLFTGLLCLGAWIATEIGFYCLVFYLVITYSISNSLLDRYKPEFLKLLTKDLNLSEQDFKMILTLKKEHYL